VTGSRGRAPRESYAERRARRSAIDEPEVVLTAAFRYLEARARSVVETRRRLAEAGYRPELVEGAIERLLAIGLLDDEVFARNWIESRDRASPRGETTLRRELRLRGVEGAIVDATLEARRSGEAESRLGFRRPDLADEADGSGVGDPEETAARRLLDRRRRDLDRVIDPRKRRARAYALLARNGFSPEIAGRLAAALVAEGDAES
jgi:SOS response regulatory protein OraA/RecX